MSVFLGPNFILIRKKWRLNQTNMGELLESNKGQVTSYERGISMPNIPLLVRLSELSGISINEILGRTIDISEIPDNPILENLGTGLVRSKMKTSEEPTGKNIDDLAKSVKELVEQLKILQEKK